VAKRRPALRNPLGLILRAGTFAGASDRELVERFLSRRGEFAEAAFEALVLRHGPTVLAVCRRLLSDPNDADDAFQATFLVLARKAASVRNSESLGTWLSAVARRVANHSRLAAHRRSAVERSAAATSAKFAPAQHNWEIWDEVERLPRTLQAAVLLCYLEGLTHEQAAARLNWPVGTVRSRLARARAQLRGRLRRAGFSESAELFQMPAVHSLCVPERLVNPMVKAALFTAARDGAEVGPVSASVASLAKGAIFAMSAAKLKALAAVLVATGFLVCGAVYAFQDSYDRGGDPLIGNTNKNRFSASRKGVVDESSKIALDGWDRPQPKKGHPESFPSRIVLLVNQARERQDRGEFGSALETLVTVQELVGQWRRLLAREVSEPTPTNIRDDVAKKGAPEARGKTAIERSDSSANDRRLDELERTVRQILRMLEADRGRFGRGGPGEEAPQQKNQ
jgi:RNA polymerase sigma factor (sigma-70 family)